MTTLLYGIALGLSIATFVVVLLDLRDERARRKREHLRRRRIEAASRFSNPSEVIADMAARGLI